MQKGEITMTQEEKSILLKDLCARLPYGVKGIITYDKSNTTFTVEGIDNNILHLSDAEECYVEDFKLYLRLISSMTKEEKLHVELTYGFCYHDGVLDNVHIFEAGGTYDRDGNYEPLCEYRQEKHVTIEQVLDFIHWLNAHHFDYRGLIPMNLALEAPEGMYNVKEK